MMDHFFPHFDTLQAAILSIHYHKDVGGACSCGTATAPYQCEECFQPQMFCRSCIISTHIQHPFHHIGEWCGMYFKRTSLFALGAVLCLGHRGKKCRNRLPGPGRNSVIVHTNGIHHVSIEYCRCEDVPDAIQLARSRLFPATMDRPETAFTFAVLNDFHMHSLTSKKSAMDYVDALQKHTNAAFPQKVPVSMVYSLWGSRY
jgi:CxC2 like cysteine cluster associated with KDZ transposases